MSRGEERRVLRPSSWRIREVVVGEDMVAGLGDGGLWLWLWEMVMNGEVVDLYVDVKCV